MYVLCMYVLVLGFFMHVLCMYVLVMGFLCMYVDLCMLYVWCSFCIFEHLKKNYATDYIWLKKIYYDKVFM